MKLYGTDLKKLYNKNLKEREALFNKINKRYLFLVKNTPETILEESGFYKVQEYPDDPYAETIMNLEQILKIEKAYIKKSKQLDLFK